MKTTIYKNRSACTASINAVMRCLMCGRSEVQIPGHPNLTRHCKRFVTTSTYTEVAVLH